MTAHEFNILLVVDCAIARQGLEPFGLDTKRIKELLYYEGFGELETPQITSALVAMRSRRLVMSRPGKAGALWLPTLYGRNVVGA